MIPKKLDRYKPHLVTSWISLKSDQALAQNIGIRVRVTLTLIPIFWPRTRSDFDDSKKVRQVLITPGYVLDISEIRPSMSSKYRN
jgi:hypothetical protein